MDIEILFNEACGLYGDAQNGPYLEATLPDAVFHYTKLVDTPYFAEHDPDLILMGTMPEKIQRKVIEKLMPYRDRLLELIDKGTPILATGNAGEVFAKEIHYVTEKITVPGLDFFDLTVKTDFFRRYNGKTLGKVEDFYVMGFRSQFSFLYGDNSSCCFMQAERGIGIDPESKYEGMRKHNLMCTQLLGPILPLNPQFCEYLISLTGHKADAAHRSAAMDAYEQRLKEFTDPTTKF